MTEATYDGRHQPTFSTNHIELTGTIKQCWPIQTRTGRPMVKFLLTVGGQQPSTFWVLAYGNLADLIRSLPAGTELGISGTCQINSWQREDGSWSNEFNSVAWAVEINGQVTKYAKPGADGPTREKVPPSGHPGQQDYQGGPF